MVGDRTFEGVLYSFRRCPYAIRARWMLALANVDVELREVVLRDKPAEMLALSPKATVPVLQLRDGRVLDESRAIMRWVVESRADTQLPNWWPEPLPASQRGWIDTVDGPFKHHLDRYKYASRHAGCEPERERDTALKYLERFESLLANQPMLAGPRLGLIDVAIVPFVRQFAHVDLGWFADRSPHLHRWMLSLIRSRGFVAIMSKHIPWTPGDEPVRFLADTEGIDMHAVSTWHTSDAGPSCSKPTHV